MMSFLCTDTKGDLFHNYAGTAPRTATDTESPCWICVIPPLGRLTNLLHLINKYMDIYKADPKTWRGKAKAKCSRSSPRPSSTFTSGGTAPSMGRMLFLRFRRGPSDPAIFVPAGGQYLPTRDADGESIESATSCRCSSWCRNCWLAG